MTTLTLIADEILLDGRPIARLLPNVRLSARDQLQAAFDAADEDYVEHLEEKVAALEEQLTKGRRA